MENFYKMGLADTEQLLRLIESILSLFIKILLTKKHYICIKEKLLDEYY